MTDTPVQVDAEGYVVEPQPFRFEYDFETHILGQRYLCNRKADAAGYNTIPVAD
jgi:hypothetical protein